MKYEILYQPGVKKTSSGWLWLHVIQLLMTLEHVL